MFLTNKMVMAAGLLMLFVAGVRSLPGEPFLRYDPIVYQVDDEDSTNQNDDEPFEELGVDFIKMPDNAEKGYRLYKFIKGLQRRRELHLKSGPYAHKPLFTSGFLDLYVDRIPTPDVPKVNHAYVGGNHNIQCHSECKGTEVAQEKVELETAETNSTEPKLFFNLLLTYNKDIHYIFFFVIEHDYNVLTNMYYLRS